MNTLPHLNGPEARLVIDLLELLIDTLIDYRARLIREHHPWGVPADDELPF